MIRVDQFLVISCRKRGRLPRDVDLGGQIDHRDQPVTIRVVLYGQAQKDGTGGFFGVHIANEAVPRREHADAICARLVSHFKLVIFGDSTAGRLMASSGAAHEARAIPAEGWQVLIMRIEDVSARVNTFQEIIGHLQRIVLMLVETCQICFLQKT